VVVLHQLGNHGPAYFRRYPPEMKRFTPACESNELRDCTPAQIVNAYDNAILYTDRVLADTIAFLTTRQERFDVALVYASDHGESLGERGLYLHGLPYVIAPSEQLEVPMLWWLPAPAAQALGVDLACLRRKTADKASQDNLYHSTLGLLRVQTPRYRQRLDLFQGCRPAH
jgi:lipid A ethanolaminephosphotransferase